MKFFVIFVLLFDVGMAFAHPSQCGPIAPLVCKDNNNDGVFWIYKVQIDGDEDVIEAGSPEQCQEMINNAAQCENDNKTYVCRDNNDDGVFWVYEITFSKDWLSGTEKDVREGGALQQCQQVAKIISSNACL